MPILIPAADDRPLEQGDLLDDIVTSVSVVGDMPEVKTTHVLVVSRPCNAIRDAEIIVARVMKRSLTGVQDPDTLADLVDFFKGLRDGEGAPDAFYLGELEVGSNDRYFAKFNTLHTIKIPLEAARRDELLKKHRRFRLAPDFARDLHLRLFRAFASLGFGDDNWWTDSDLNFLAAKGVSIRKKQEGLVESARVNLTALEIAGAAQKEKNKLKDELAAAEKQLSKTNELLDPLLEEQRARPERREVK